MSIQDVPQPTQTASWPVCSSCWPKLTIEPKPTYRHMPNPQVCCNCGGLTLSGWELPRKPEEVHWDRMGNSVVHPQHTGYCPICLKSVTYVTSSRSGYWIHDDTSLFTSREPREHDVNTYSREILTSLPTKDGPAS